MNPQNHDIPRLGAAWATSRQAEIAEIVRVDGMAKVDELATRFAVTPQTIRKDINEMCARGLLRRVHGGVELAQANAAHYQLRRILNLEPKRAIGRAVAGLIPDRATIAVSIGTTPELAVAGLGRHRDLRVYTNNLHLALAVQGFDAVSVTIPGGTLRPSEADIVGPSAVDFFSRYRYDFGIFGVAAVDDRGELLDLNEEDALTRQAIAANADTRLLVLDISKFGRKAHVRSGHIAGVDHVICDSRPPEPIRGMLQEAGVALTICDEAAA